MKMRFTGTYTGGRNTITYFEHTFTGHEPREVTPEVADKLKSHPEFEEAKPEPEAKPRRKKIGVK